MNPRIKGRKIGITMILSVMSIALSIGINFTLTPYITNAVGAEAYGLVSLAKTFTSYANIFMVALNSYAARYLTIAYFNKHDKEFNQYFSTVFLADVAVGGALFIIGTLCVIKLDSLLNISPELVSDVKLLFLLTFFAFFLTTINTVFNASAYVKDHLDLANIIKVISYITEAIILLFCFIVFDASVWYVGVASVGMATITLVSSYVMTRKLLPNAHVEIKAFSVDALKRLVGNGLWNSINSLGNGLNSGLDLLMTNLLLTGTAMGQISISKTLTNVVFQLYDAMSQPFQPTFLRKYADGDKPALLRDITRAMSICGLFTNVVFAGFCAVGKDFLDLWIPTQDTAFIYRLVIIALLPAISEGCIYPAYYIYTLTLKNKVPCVITILGGVANVTGMYFLLKYTSMGAYAILITTAVVMNFINLVTNPIYMSICLKISKTNFYPTLLKNIVYCAVTTAVLVFVNSIFNFNLSWITLFIKIVILAIIGVAFQIPLVFGKDTMSIIRKVCKRRSGK